FAVTASVALRVVARLAVGSTRPQRAVRLLVGGSFAATLALGLTLSAVGLAVAGRAAPIAALGQWSAPVLTVLVPVPAWIGIAAGVAAVTLGSAAVIRCVHIATALVKAETVSRQLRHGRGPVVLLHDDTVDAYTIAGVRGCVVIGAGLFDQLGPTERRVLLAHEFSHLRRRHHLYLHAVDLAAAANPLLRGMPDIVRLGIERWADEDAVDALDGDRRTVALTLATVAQIKAASTSLTRPAVTTLAAAGTHLTQRVTALLTPCAKRLPAMILLAGVAVTVAAMLASTVSAAQIQDRMEIAQHAINPYHAPR
ncbi:MAG TPA: M56 family metallopeptidase, partial [Steroidobacteraceae bacterium]